MIYLHFLIFIYSGICKCVRFIVLHSVVDPKLFFSDPDPTFQEILDPDPISDPT